MLMVKDPTLRIKWLMPLQLVILCDAVPLYLLTVDDGPATADYWGCRATLSTDVVNHATASAGVGDDATVTVTTDG